MPAWCGVQIVCVAGTQLVLGAFLYTHLLDRREVRAVQTELAASVQESMLRSSRLRALWQVATIDGVTQERHLEAILEIALANLRPGRRVCGYVSHEEDGVVVVDAITGVGQEDGSRCTRNSLYAGHRKALEDTLEQHLLTSGRTTCANAVGNWPERWGSGVGAPLLMGTRPYFVVFASIDSMEDAPFGDEDLAFVNVLTSHLSSRFCQDDQLKRIRYQMEHDVLTGLMNRSEFCKATRAAIARDADFAVALLDVDRFREVNEAEGHPLGDEVLVEIAMRLDAVECGDLVARLGADDFGIVMHGITSDGVLAGRLERYAKCFDSSFRAGNHDGAPLLPLTCSIGAAYFPRDARTEDGLMARADVALDVAKKRGGASVVVFSSPMEEAARVRHLRRREILEGLAEDTFVLEYQPTFDLRTRALVGAEALIRWNHPARGRLMPGEFIEFAERNGIIGRISRWVVDRAVKDLGDLPLPDGFRCYLNVPVHLLDDAVFLSEFEASLDAVPSLAQHFGIEVTETEAMEDADKTIHALLAIRRRGLRVAIDDFGTGYSSMAYLKRLPIDMVKIDRSFVAGLPHDEKDVAVAEVFLHLTQRLGLISLAEGIETEEQAAWLRDQGCKLGQGLLVAPPLPYEEFRTRLAGGSFLPVVSI